MFKSGANKKNRNRWRCSFDHRCVKVHSQLLTTNMLQRHRAKPAIQCEGGISYMSRDLHEYTKSSLVGPYAYHYLNMVNQLAMFSEIKKSLGNNRAVFKEWSGAHSCYYTRDSVTVFPIVLIFAEDSAVIRDSDIMSDDLKHICSWESWGRMLTLTN